MTVSYFKILRDLPLCKQVHKYTSLWLHKAGRGKQTNFEQDKLILLST